MFRKADLIFYWIISKSINAAIINKALKTIGFTVLLKVLIKLIPYFY